MVPIIHTRRRAEIKKKEVAVPLIKCAIEVKSGCLKVTLINNRASIRWIDVFTTAALKLLSICTDLARIKFKFLVM